MKPKLLPADAAIAEVPAEYRAAARRLLRSGSVKFSKLAGGERLYSPTLLAMAARVTEEERRALKAGSHRTAALPGASRRDGSNSEPETLQIGFAKK